MKDTRVYFAKSADGSAIKIGFSRDPVRIMKQLNRSGTPTLMGSINGDAGVEQDLHVYFANFRIESEWFRADEELTDRVALMIERGYAVGEEIAGRVGMRYVHAKIDEETYRGLVVAARATSKFLSYPNRRSRSTTLMGQFRGRKRAPGRRNGARLTRDPTACNCRVCPSLPV